VLSRAAFDVDVCIDGDAALSRLDDTNYGAIVLALVQSLIRARLRKPFHIEELVGAVRSCFE
jgi:DNA-binding response OmpR family regulator